MIISYQIDDDQSPVKVNGFDDKNVADPFSNTNGSTKAGSFEDQDPFASSKAREAFASQGGDPFGNSFNSQPSSVSI